MPSMTSTLSVAASTLATSSSLLTGDLSYSQRTSAAYHADETVSSYAEPAQEIETVLIPLSTTSSATDAFEAGM